MIDIISLTGEVTKQIDTPKILQCKDNPTLFKEVIEYHSNKKRFNLACVKTKNELSYSNRKKFRQKGTGRARAGNLHQSQHRHGVKLFGPNGKLYQYNIPKKKIQQGLAIALSNRFANGQLVVINNLQLDTPKTKLFLQCMNNLKLEKCMFLDQEFNSNFQLASRNVINMNICASEHVNALKLLKHNYIVITENALESLNRRIYGAQS